MQLGVGSGARPGHRTSAIVGVIIALGWPLLFLGADHDLLNVRDDIRTICVEWAVVLVLALIAFRMQRRRPSAFGLAMFGWRDVLAMLALLAAAYLFSGLVSSFVKMPARLDFHRLGTIPLALRAGLTLTAGIAEECMYRGFGIEELGDLIGSRWLAALVSLLCFTFGHAGRYGFSPALLIPGGLGAALTVLYLWRRNLPICMCMHAILDGISLILVPALMHATGR